MRETSSMNGVGEGPIIRGSAAWVWPSLLGDSPNQYVQFRHEFVLDSVPSQAGLRLSCDSNYALWVNGEFVDCGQFHDYPDRKSCDVIGLSNLERGANVLAFLVHYQGEGSFQYLKGSPALVYTLEAGGVIISSGRETLYRLDPGYRQGTVARITPQLGFTFGYNAPKEDDWRSADYRPDGTWTALSDADLTGLDARPIERIRPLPKLVFGERIESRMVAQGLFLRKDSSEGTIAQLMQTDYLSPRPRSGLFEGGKVIRREAVGNADGVYMVLDLGREEAGFLDLDLEACAGTTVDIAWGEHLDDLRVRARIGQRNFASRYVCKEGRGRFVHYFTRLAGRYIQLHIGNITKDVIIHYAGLVPVEYPIEVRGSFTCPDALHQRIYDTCVRTLHLCMHEHYEDCPWREQALYAMDMRNQALAGYYCFGEYTFPAVSLDLLARGLKPDGFLELCAPAEIAITIPVFTLAWILAAADHHLYSGDRNAARRFFPTMRYILEKCAEAAGDGLLPCPLGDRYWQFYDWAEGLDGCEWNDCTRFAVLNETRCDAPLNLFYCLALEAAAGVAEGVGDLVSKTTYLARAAALKPLIHNQFWDGDDQSYVSYSGGGAPLHRSELVQALSVLAGVCDDGTAEILRERVAAADNGLVKTTLSYSFYKFEALLTDMEVYGPQVFEMISTDWGRMLYQGATSFWETIKGGDDFSGAGSLCHGWSGIPVYFYHAYLLGVKPTSPGFGTFTDEPLPAMGDPPSGTVPTPDGTITITGQPL